MNEGDLLVQKTIKAVARVIVEAPRLENFRRLASRNISGAMQLTGTQA